MEDGALTPENPSGMKRIRTTPQAEIEKPTGLYFKTNVNTISGKEAAMMQIYTAGCLSFHRANTFVVGCLAEVVSTSGQEFTMENSKISCTAERVPVYNKRDIISKCSLINGVVAGEIMRPSRFGVRVMSVGDRGGVPQRELQNMEALGLLTPIDTVKFKVDINQNEEDHRSVQLLVTGGFQCTRYGTPVWHGNFMHIFERYDCRVDEYYARMSVVEWTTLYKDMLSALKYVHGKGWVHTNLRPENIGVKVYRMRDGVDDVYAHERFVLMNFKFARPGKIGLSPTYPEIDEGDEALINKRLEREYDGYCCTDSVNGHSVTYRGDYEMLCVIMLHACYNVTRAVVSAQACILEVHRGGILPWQWKWTDPTKTEVNQVRHLTLPLAQMSIVARQRLLFRRSDYFNYRVTKGAFLRPAGQEECAERIVEEAFTVKKAVARSTSVGMPNLIELIKEAFVQLFKLSYNTNPSIEMYGVMIGKSDALLSLIPDLYERPLRVTSTKARGADQKLF